MMNRETKELLYNAETAKCEFLVGAITYEECKERVMPYIDKVNQRSVELAKKYNQKPRKITFKGFMR